MPDPSLHRGICADDILGIVLTHAHEDHIGAVGWLWPRLKAPLYATPFTAYLLREKLREAGILDDVSAAPRCRSAGRLKPRSVRDGAGDVDALDSRAERPRHHARRWA